MKWKIIEHNNMYLVCRKTWHSADWMGIEKTNIHIITAAPRSYAVEVYAECSTKELALKLLTHNH